MGEYLSVEELEAGIDHVRSAPADGGALVLISTRPADGERELLEWGEIDLDRGLVGDNWSVRPSSATPDNSPDPEAQLTVMNARAAALCSGSTELEAWAPTGDQLYVDLDLSARNLPPGARLEIGDAVIEVTAKPHLGCGKFVRRFGVDALKVFNSDLGRAERLRGLNARVVRGGRVTRGDAVGVIR